MNSTEKQSLWRSLSASNRKTAVTAGAALVGVILLYLFMNATPENRQSEPSTSTLDTNVLTGEDTHSLGISAMSNDIKGNRDAVAGMKTDMQEMESRLQRQLDLIVTAVERTGAQVQQVDAKARDRLTALSDAQRAAEASRESDAVTIPAPGEQTSEPPAATPTQTQGGPQLPALDQPIIRVPDRVSAPRNIWADPARAPSESSASRLPGAVALPDRASSMPPPVLKIISSSPPASGEKSPPPPSPADFLTIPTGSIISGTLLTGVDAVTGMQGTKEPVPALLRVKHQAILPNRFKADVRECFVVLSTNADLSNERVMMRGETFSCVHSDGGIIETDIKSFVTGEDGKAGVRGHLVHRSGQLVARAALAGLVSGLAQVFQPIAVNSVSTNPGNTQQYQTPNAGEALQSSAYNGINQAGERLSEYWIELADKVLPVLEVSGGREVDMVLLSQLKLLVNGGSVDIEDAFSKTSIGAWYAVGSRLPKLNSGNTVRGAMK